MAVKRQTTEKQRQEIRDLKPIRDKGKGLLSAQEVKDLVVILAERHGLI